MAMGVVMPWTDRIGRNLKLHDLHVLMAVIQAGSMGKAAQRLNTAQPAISRSIAALEHAFGVPLLDRSRRGVEPTKHGRALLDCGVAVFDELRQGVKRMDFLSDPTTGEVRIGGNEAIIAGALPAVFERLRRRYPGILIHVTQAAAFAQQYRDLRERKIDFIFGRVAPSVEEDVDVEILFQERLFVVAGVRHRLSRRRKIELAELAEGPWALSPPDSLVGSLVSEAFRASGVEVPSKSLATGLVHLQCALVASGGFLAILPGSMLRFCANLPPLKVLPVTLPVSPWPVGITVLKNRTPNPAAQLFIECTRGVVKPLALEK
jgi:DNA-binding transcriptional LysR family regulator